MTDPAERLAPYRSKRDFSATPEPAGADAEPGTAVADGELRFEVR